MNDVNAYLEENNLSIISSSDNSTVVSYKYDIVELDAAKSYAQSLDCSIEEQNEEFKQYLSDIVFDNISDILDEISEDFNLELTFNLLESNELEQLIVINKK